jgi:hypothetical protein
MARGARIRPPPTGRLSALVEGLPAVVRRKPAIRRLAHALGGESASAAVAALRLPAWIDELEPQVRRDSLAVREAAQLRVLCSLLLVDADEEAGRPVDVHAARLVADARRILGQIFPRGGSFWDGFDRLAREQEASARWELRERGKPQRLDRALLRALGSKAAFLRWPAIAAAELSGRGLGARRRIRRRDRAAARSRGQPAAAEQAPRLERLLEKLFIAHQLLDDQLDVEQDAASGQPNAFWAALGRRRKSDGPMTGEALRRARAAAAVCKATRNELRYVLRRVPARCGLALHCKTLLRWCDVLERRAADGARLRVVIGICDRLVA